MNKRKEKNFISKEAKKILVRGNMYIVILLVNTSTYY